MNEETLGYTIIGVVIVGFLLFIGFIIFIQAFTSFFGLFFPREKEKWDYQEAEYKERRKRERAEERAKYNTPKIWIYRILFIIALYYAWQYVIDAIAYKG